jgi:hypothetical protein
VDVLRVDRRLPSKRASLFGSAGASQFSEIRGEFETPRGRVETSIRGVSYGLGVGHLRTRGLADMAQVLLSRS